MVAAKTKKKAAPKKCTKKKVLPNDIDAVIISGCAATMKMTGYILAGLNLMALFAVNAADKEKDIRALIKKYTGKTKKKEIDISLHCLVKALDYIRTLNQIDEEITKIHDQQNKSTNSKSGS